MKEGQLSITKYCQITTIWLDYSIQALQANKIWVMLAPNNYIYFNKHLDNYESVCYTYNVWCEVMATFGIRVSQPGTCIGIHFGVFFGGEEG